MATATDKLRYVVEVVGGRQAAAELNSVGAAATTSGSRLGSMRSALMGSTGVLAGLAGVAAVGKTVVGAFQDLALKAGQFADATGMSAEQASRWIEVAGDIGIEASSLETAIGRMAKTLGATPQLFEQFGVAVQRTANGTVDINATFLALIDRLNSIADPAERARVAAATLGRGWQDLAELIGQGSAKIGESLAEVSDAKVIDAEEVQKARDARAAMDDLTDAVEDLALRAGEVLIPTLTRVARHLVGLSVAADPLVTLFDRLAAGLPKEPGDWPERWSRGLPIVHEGLEFIDQGLTEINGHADGLGSIWDQLKKVTDALTPDQRQSIFERLEREKWAVRLTHDVAGLGQVFHRQLVPSLWSFTEAADEAGRRSAWLAAQQMSLARAASESSRELDRLNGELDMEESAARFTGAFARLNDELKKRKSDQAAVADMIRDLKRDVVNYADLLGAIPSEIRTRILAELDSGSFAEAERQLAIFMRNRTVAVSLRGVGTGLSGMIGADRRFDSGGVVPGPKGSPQVILAHGGETVLPTHKTAAASTFHVTVNAGLGVDGAALGRQIVDALKDFERSHGTGWRN